MPALTTAALVLGGAQVLGGIGKAAAGYVQNAPLESQQKRIAELERMQQADTLGLTGQERQAFMEAFMDPQRAIAGQQLQQTQALSGMAQDSGEQLRRMRSQEEQAQRALAESNRQIAMLDMQQARAQEQELLQLQMSSELREQAQKAALIGGGTEAAMAAAQMGSQAIAMSELSKIDPGAADAMNMAEIGAMYGYAFPQYSQMPTGAPYNPYSRGFGIPNPYMYGPGFGQPGAMGPGNPTGGQQ